MITGGVAVVIYGDPRFTRDVDDPLHTWGMARRQRIQLETTAIWVAPMEYVILRKLQYYRASGSDRHLRDVAMMLRVSEDLLDHGELQGWLARLELDEVYAEARRHSPEP